MAGRPKPSAADLQALDPDGDFQQRLRDDHTAVASLSDSHDLEPLKVVAHQLAGAAATFGYPELGEVATALDERFQRSGKVTAADVARLLAALDEALGPKKSG